MNDFLYKILDIEKEEKGPVLLLLSNSFLIGVFLVTYDVASSTLFLDTFGQEYLTRIPIMSGILGMISASIFARLQRTLRFTTLALWVFILISVFAVCLFIGLEYYRSKWLIFGAYLAIFPVNTILLLCFYGTVSRSFNLKQEKRITGTVDQGQMLATTIAFFAVPVLSGFVPDVVKFLLASAISATLAFFAMFFFVRRYYRNILKHEKRKSEMQIARFAEERKNPYIKSLALLFLASVIATSFVEYSFLSVSVEKYTNEKDLASFLGFFGGLLTIFSFGLQTLVGDRIINTYGMKISLLIIPVLLGAFTILAALVGTIFGTTIESESFIIFFLFMAMSKLLLQSSKETFEDPIIKNMFLPLDYRKRFDIQTKIEGVFKEFSNVVAGLLLTGLALFLHFGPLHFNYFLILVCLVYAYAIIKLYREYRNTLTNTLVAQRASSNIEHHDTQVLDLIKNGMDSGEQSQVVYHHRLLEKLEPMEAENCLSRLVLNNINGVRMYAWKKFASAMPFEKLDELKPALLKENTAGVKALAQVAIDQLEKEKTENYTSSRLVKLIKSRKKEERIHAAHNLARYSKPEFTPHLMVLLRDTDPAVRLAAIVTAGKLRKHETWPLLIDYLSSPLFSAASSAALQESGEKVFPLLEAAFYRTGQNMEGLIKIMHIYSRVRGNMAIQLLWNKTSYPDKKIVTYAWNGLKSIGFTPNYDQSVRIKQLAETTMGNIAWNMAALTEIEKESFTKPLIDAIEEEIRYHYNEMYMLLSFIYDAQSVNLVKQNIESGTIEGSVYAIELLDVFLAEDLKPMLFPLIEDISQEERNERLENYFPREKLGKTEVLLQIINRDFNFTGRWTKTCAIYAYVYTEGAVVRDDLIANLFNPDALLRETSAWAIYSLDETSYFKHIGRIAENERKLLDNKILNSWNRKMLRFQRIFFLKEMVYFKNLSGEALSGLDDYLEEQHFNSGEYIFRDCPSSEVPVFMVKEGAVKLFHQENEFSVIERKEISGELLSLDPEEGRFSAEAEGNTIIFSINADKFFDILSHNIELAKEFIRLVSGRLNDNGPVALQTLEQEEV